MEGMEWRETEGEKEREKEIEWSQLLLERHKAGGEKMSLGPSQG